MNSDYTLNIEDANQSFYNLILFECNNIKNKIKTDYENKINKLLLDICKGENLDFNYLKEKYCKNKNKNTDKIILEKIIYNDLTYYYENKENGNVYDNSSNVVGYYNGKLNFT